MLQCKSGHRCSCRRGSLALSEIQRELSAEMDRFHYRPSYKRPRGSLEGTRNPKSRVQVQLRAKVGNQMWRVQAWYCSSKFSEQLSSAGIFLRRPPQRHHQASDTAFVILNQIFNVLAPYFSCVAL